MSTKVPTVLCVLSITTVVLIYIHTSVLCSGAIPLDISNRVYTYRTEDSELDPRIMENNLNESLHQTWKATAPIFNQTVPTIFVVTPTYARLLQKSMMIKMVQALINVPNLHWIVVEDAFETSELIENLLHKSGIKFTCLCNSSTLARPGETGAGVIQRNTAIEWIRKNVNPTHERGVVYFADDDNTYDTQLFEEMRFTKKVSVWPVAFVGGRSYQRAFVKNGTVVGWDAGYAPGRPFAVDMAGFAVNIEMLFNHPKALFPNYRGVEETQFLSSINITLADLEPKADNCTKVLVWHTQGKPPRIGRTVKDDESSQAIEVK